jgi:hypothetical protein
LLAIEARQMDDRDHVVGQRLAIALQRLGPVLAGLAAGNAKLDQLALGEQAHCLRRTQQC